MRALVFIAIVACGNGHEAQHAANVESAAEYRAALEGCLLKAKAGTGTLDEFFTCKAGVDAIFGKKDGGR